MKKYIVPTKYEMMEWRFLFGDVHREEEFQIPIVKELVNLSFWLADAKIKNETLMSLHEQVFSMVTELNQTGIVSDDKVELTVEMGYTFSHRLAKYLMEIGIITKEPTTMSFEGFLGLNIIIKVLDDGEIDETDERVCLSG